MQVIKYVILTNKLTETYVANADHNAIQLELDFTGTDYASWAKWVQLLMNDGTEDLKELGTDTIVHFTLTSAHTKQGYLSINPKAISADGSVKGFPIRTVSIDKQLNVEQVSSELQQSIIDYFNQRLAIKAVSTETLDPDQPVDVVVQQAADGQTYLFKIPKGVKGNTGAQVVSAAFSGNDIVFTLDDASTATLIGAAITLKGAKGDTGAKIVSAAFVGNDIIITLDDASTVTLIDAAITLKGSKGDKGIVWRGAYAAGTAYVIDDVVSYQGSSWICIQNSTGNVPTNASYWSLFAQAGSVNETQLNAKADKLYATNLVTNGDFSNGTTGWSSTNGSLSVASNKLTLTINNTTLTRVGNPLSIVNGRKYYVRAQSIEQTNLSTTFTITTRSADLLTLVQQVDDLYNRTPLTNYSVLFTATGNAGSIAFNMNIASTPATFVLGRFLVIDLTTTFGAGKEPSVTQMDNMLSTFTNSWFNGTAELVSIANLAQLKADKTQEAWQSLTLTNSWVTNELQLRFMKDQFGFVHIEGNIKSGVIGINAATLPAGYRPLLTKRFPVATATGYGRINIANTGAISINEGSNTWVAIDGVVFKAEA